MRGKVPLVISIAIVMGITPAYAGKSRLANCDFHVLQDHPRLCGEKLDPQNGQRFNLGSPPPMRGKGYVWRLKGTFNRITPAYAGKSRRSKEIF